MNGIDYQVDRWLQKVVGYNRETLDQEIVADFDSYLSGGKLRPESTKDICLHSAGFFSSFCASPAHSSLTTHGHPVVTHKVIEPRRILIGSAFSPLFLSYDHPQADPSI